MSVSTIYRIRAKKKEILEAAKRSLIHKRIVETKYPVVEQFLLEWVEQARMKNLIISDDILQTQALQFAREQHMDDFKASEKWVLGFKKKYGIRSLSLQGEAASVDGATVEEYKVRFQDLLKEFNPSDIFNLDETGLFYKLLPNRTLCSEAKAKGMKSSKERVSVVFCVSYTGEKLPPLVIGKTAKPRSFKGLDLDKIGVKYTSTFKSWMTSTLFQDYLTEINKQMSEKKRRILLLVDLAPSHRIREELTNVVVEFLPKNTTSVLQPLDQGIIRSFKASYRDTLIKYLITIGRNTAEVMKGINLGLVMTWIGDAWKKVSEVTITNCFNHTGLFGVEAEVLSSDTAVCELQAQLTTVKATATVEEYLGADEIDPVYDCSEENLHREVCERISAFEQESDESEDESTPQRKRPLRGVTTEQTLAHVAELRRMMSCAEKPEIRQSYQKIILELMGGTEPLLKQARLDSGPA